MTRRPGSAPVRRRRPLPAGRAHRRDRQLPRPLDDRAGRRPPPTGVEVVAIDPARRQRPRARRRSPGSPTRRPTDRDAFRANLERGRCRRPRAPRRRVLRRDAHDDVDGPDRRALHRRRPPLRPGARRHPRLGPAGHGRRHVADPRRRSRRSASPAAIAARARRSAAASATSGGRARSPSTAPTCPAAASAGAQRRRASSPSSAGSPATSALKVVLTLGYGTARRAASGARSRSGRTEARGRRPALWRPDRRRLTGWGRTAPSAATRRRALGPQRRAARRGGQGPRPAAAASPAASAARTATRRRTAAAP